MRRFAAIVTALFFLASSYGCAWKTRDQYLLGTATLAKAADAYTTCKALNNPDNYEMNPLLGKHPSDRDVVAFLAVSLILTVIVAQLWEKGRTLVLGASTAINGACAINNANLDWDGDGKAR